MAVLNIETSTIEANVLSKRRITLICSTREIIRHQIIEKIKRSTTTKTFTFRFIAAENENIFALFILFHYTVS